MLRELSQDPTSGYLGAESWFGNPTILLQYWRSFEDLDSYAKKNQLRAPARMGRRSIAPWVAGETWASGMRHTASNRETSNAFKPLFPNRVMSELPVTLVQSRDASLLRLREAEDQVLG